MERQRKHRGDTAARRQAAWASQALGAAALAAAAAWALALPAAAAGQPEAAAAAAAQPHQAHKVHKVHKAHKKPPQKVVHAQPEPRLPGGETRAERERRLKRECKGRPNAGACLGYAS